MSFYEKDNKKLKKIFFNSISLFIKIWQFFFVRKKYLLNIINKVEIRNMAVPFRRKSKKKVREGRSVDNLNFQKKIFSQVFNDCSCEKKKKFHFICAHCFKYRKLDFSKKITD